MNAVLKYMCMCGHWSVEWKDHNIHQMKCRACKKAKKDHGHE